MLRSQLEPILQEQLGSDLTIIRFEATGGGCINECYKLHTSKGYFFLKANRSPYAADMFEKEMKGLSALREANLFRIPQVVMQGYVSDRSFLLLEYISGNRASDEAWNFTGKQLAALHCIRSEKYGLDYDNYIGRLPQKNQLHETFHDFFINERLKPLVKMAEKKNLLGHAATDLFESLYIKLPDMIPYEPPALLHGDLWIGNIMFDTFGNTVLIDPAIYFGNRETEIAFTMLFGGFDKKFYQSYNYHYPLQSGFEKRADLYNLYPLLVHLNLFGSSYFPDILKILKSYH